MKVTQEINLLKKEIKSLKQQICKLNDSFEKLLKSGQTKNINIQKKKAIRRLSYIDWLNNERKMKDLIPP